MATPPFQPHPLLLGGQLQTIAGTLLPTPPPSVQTVTERIPLPDGDQLLLHIDYPAKQDDRPLVLMLHGLGGSSESGYLLRLSAKVRAAGYTALRFNHRGCGPGGAPLAREIYHAGRGADLAACLAFIESRWPNRPYYVVAFSLSGNMLLRYLGDCGDRTPRGLTRALAVCPPIDLELCSLALDAPYNLHIDRYYTKLLLATAAAKSQLFPDTEPPRFPRKMSLRLFDELYTAPRGGFANRDAYYGAASAAPVMGAIRVPTQILAAADDPIIPPASFAVFTEGKSSAAVTLRMERDGGHMGFIARRQTRLGDRRWMDLYVTDWVEGRA